jgi:hypothetical protein
VRMASATARAASGSRNRSTNNWLFIAHHA